MKSTISQICLASVIVACIGFYYQDTSEANLKFDTEQKKNNLIVDKENHHSDIDQ